MRFLILLSIFAELAFAAIPCPVYLSENITFNKSISKKKSVPWMVRSTSLNATPVSKQEVLDEQIFRLSSGLKSNKYKDYTVELTYKYVNLKGTQNEAVLKDFKFHNRLGYELDIPLLQELQKNITDLKDETLELDEIELKNLERKIEQGKNVFYHFRELGIRDESLPFEIKKTIDEVESLYASLKEISNYDDFSKKMNVYDITFGDETISVLSKLDKRSIIEYQDFMKSFLYESKYQIKYKTKKQLSKITNVEVTPRREQSDLYKIKNENDYEKYKKELVISNIISRNIDGVLNLVNYRKGLIILGVSIYGGNKILQFFKGEEDGQENPGLEEEDIIDVFSQYFNNFLNSQKETILSEEDYKRLIDEMTIRFYRENEESLEYEAKQDSTTKKIVITPVSKTNE